MSYPSVISRYRRKWSHFSESLNSIVSVLEPRIYPFFKSFNVIPRFIFLSFTKKLAVPSPSKVVFPAGHFTKENVTFQCKLNSKRTVKCSTNHLSDWCSLELTNSILKSLQALHWYQCLRLRHQNDLLNPSLIFAYVDILMSLSPHDRISFFLLFSFITKFILLYE